MSEILLLLKPQVKTFLSNKLVLALGVVAFLLIVSLSTIINLTYFSIVTNDPSQVSTLVKFFAAILLGTQVLLFFFVIYTNFQGQKFTAGADLTLLLTSPIKVWKVFAAKFLNILLFPIIVGLSLVLPLAIGMIVGLGRPIWFYPLAILLFAGYLIVPYTLASLITVTVSFSLGKSKIREIGFFFSLLLFILYLGIGTIFPSLSSFVKFFSNNFFSTVFPAGWIAKAFFADSFLVSLFWSVLYLLFTGLVILVTFLLAERLYFSGFGGSGAKKTGVVKQKQINSSSAGPILALLKKDLKTMVKTPQELTSLFPIFLILVASFFQFNGAVDYFGQKVPGNAPFVGSMFIIIVPLSALALVSREGRGIWLLKATPLSASNFIRAKILLAYFIVFLSWVVFLLVELLFFQIKVGILAVGASIILLLTLILTTVNFGLGAVFPRFDWENPQQQVKPFVAALAFGLYIFLFAFMFIGYFSLPSAFRIVAPILGLIFTVGLCYFLVYRSIRKYEGLQIS